MQVRNYLLVCVKRTYSSSRLKSYFDRYWYLNNYGCIPVHSVPLHRYFGFGFWTGISSLVKPVLESYHFQSEILWKCMESTSFAVNNVENLTINFCLVLKCMLPLFCVGARSIQSARIQEISCWEDVEAGRSRWHLLNKMMFLLLLVT